MSEGTSRVRNSLEIYFIYRNEEGLNIDMRFIQGTYS